MSGLKSSANVQSITIRSRPWHLKQVVSAPDEPREPSAHADFEELSEPLVVAERSHHPQRVKDERARRSMIEDVDNVPGEHPRLAQGVLGESGIRLARR
jgi:hypothetical protein